MAPSTSPRTSRPSLVAGLSVRAKILGLVGALALVAAVITASGAAGMRDLKADAAQASAEQSAVFHALTSLQDGLWAVRNGISAVPGYVTDADKQKQYDNVQKAYAALDERMTAFVTAFEANIGPMPEEWAAFTESFDAYRSGVDDTLMPAAMADDREAWVAARGALADRGAALVESLTALSTYFDDSVAAANAEFLPKPLSTERLFHVIEDLTRRGHDGMLG